MDRGEARTLDSACWVTWISLPSKASHPDHDITVATTADYITSSLRALAVCFCARWYYFSVVMYNLFPSFSHMFRCIFPLSKCHTIIFIYNYLVHHCC
ncbi:hypothetical protein GBAR_LOCUS20281 [Geodia barretti]|uniref:Uncharacterized protein n=1 Tax=Geodia barretti TaxID=519541 RepID=A0AA35X2Z3_GEOBA|nr:hypothetical protein GBAR_LOCUS20281 [Geodia barretti]